MKREVVLDRASEPKELIQRLDELASSGKYQEVALETIHGSIFPWQKHKLHNLEIGGECALGFIGMNEDADGLHISLLPMPNLGALEMIDGGTLMRVYEMLNDRDEDDEDEWWVTKRRREIEYSIKKTIKNREAQHA